MLMKLKRCIAERLPVAALAAAVALCASAFRSEDVKVYSPASGVNMCGTLLVPDGAPKALVVFASGSGQQDRDETIFGHKPFKALAEAMADAGIASIRTDDRGTGCSEAGNIENATTDSLAADRAAVVDYMKDRFPDVKCGVLGHSEGAVMAVMLASGDTPDVDFIITYGAPAVPGDSIVLDQVKAVFGPAADGPQAAKVLEGCRRRYALVKSSLPDMLLEMQLYLDVMMENPALAQVPEAAERTKNELKAMTTPWYRNFLRYDPSDAIRNVKVPWLAINGGLDKQVLPYNLERISGLNPSVQAVLLPELNHIMLQSQTGLVDEYATLPGDCDPRIVSTIIDWLQSL